MNLGRTVLAAGVWCLCLSVSGQTRFGADKATMYSDAFEMGAIYSTACGPVACYVGARALGYEVSLSDMLARCDWKEGSRTSLKKLQEVMSSQDGLTSEPVRLGPSRLADILSSGDSVAILPVRKFGEDIDHSLVALRMDGDEFVLFDYPELYLRVDVAKLAEIWDGQALILSKKKSSGFARSVWMVTTVVLILGGFLLGSGLGVPRRKKS